MKTFDETSEFVAFLRGRILEHRNAVLRLENELENQLKEIKRIEANLNRCLEEGGGS